MGYQANLDWPACASWAQLVAEFPGARVLLTVREPEAWCASFRDTIARVIGPPFPEGTEDILGTAWRVILDGTFGGTLADDANLIDCFVRHDQQVIDSVDPRRLLVVDVRDGWEPLCAFVGRPVPDGPFPNINDRAFFRAMITGRERSPVAPFEDR